VAKSLVEAGADVKAAGPRAETPLHFAAANASGRKGRLAVVELLLERGADAEARSTSASRPVDLVTGSSSEDGEVMSLLS
jgi:ankyrin repeat protein